MTDRMSCTMIFLWYGMRHAERSRFYIKNVDYFESTVHGLDGQRPALTLRRKNCTSATGGKGTFASKREQRETRFPLPSGSKVAKGNDDILNNFGCASAIRASSMAFDLHKLYFINAASRYHDSPVKQRAVQKQSKGGIATRRFPPLPMKKPRNACVSEAQDD